MFLSTRREVSETRFCQRLPRYIIWISVYLAGLLFLIYSLIFDVIRNKIWIYLIIYILNIAAAAVSMTIDLKLSTSIIMYTVLALITITFTAIYCEWYIFVASSVFYFMIILLHCCCDAQSTFYPEGGIRENYVVSPEIELEAREETEAKTTIGIVIVNQPGNTPSMIGTEVCQAV